MSSVILQAADLRVLMPNVEVLVHYGDNILHGTGEQVLSGSKRIAEINDILLDIYAEKCRNSEIFKGKTKDEIKVFLDNKLKQRGDWYLNPEDAVKYGFADYILGSSKYRKISDLLLS
jgi:ATP-dependent protease ClpP protease subunit